jgi:hypothetical protein
MNDNAKMLLGFAAGVAAGIGLYAFLQSDKGKEMLHDLQDKMDDLKDGMADLAEQGRKAAENMKKGFEQYTS